MRDLLPVLRVLGMLMVMFALSMLLPFAVSWFTDDGIWRIYPWAIGITAAAGLSLWIGLDHFRRELQPRHGVILVTLVWVVLPLCAMLPLVLGMGHVGLSISFTHAYFEAVSGLTTTGATVLTGLDALPVSINVWRTFLQWLGGMGILILAVAILPLLGVGGAQLFRAEAAGPIKDTKLTPRVTETAKGLWGVYGVFSLACLLAFWAAGMSPLDALMHMFATVSLGGLSSHDTSFAYFDSPLIELTALVFMLLASCNFALYFVAMRKGRWDGFWRDPEMRATLAVLLGGGLIVALLLWAKGVYGPVEALRYGLFHVVSVATTTGFTTVDYLTWPVFAPVLMLLMSGVATSAGSTGGGIKMVRMLILLKQARRELTRLAHPRALQPVRLGTGVVDNRMIFSVLAFMLVYGATVITLSMVLLLTDLDPVTAFSAVLASVHCMGPGLGAVGPSSNYAVLTEFQTWVCTLAMLLGRLEILSFMALLSPAFWRR
ncbi:MULTISPECIES: TrkH family potassium uptake protein [Comamonadaceae]|jgi:trk system potassium uptake protein|uniref:Trk system potassium uptake protein n=1 Tax=Delftia tsuruhatensis TaxID=180282 RepID=A0AAX3SM09_9BURK|nr:MULTISPECIES: potassium transporter TrkG [Comamonadaceae]KEH13295.1 potassium transporter Trk [Delftia sp. 670]EPD40161.1 trk system potassium uptake protein TrkH [Delftia acidovorans CCUG 274B]KAF1051928.1 MAG: Trk system potassium uptake protein TrkH [Delftia tsuruhatensis]KEH07874.1 potassium transporter Trk [Delftia tsuruhatensis]MCX7508819.1 TrkH family potassium uptake protein [Delftia tsuruhatensis]